MNMLRAFLVATAVLALFSTAQAQTQTTSRIGVTQATENNPRGQPPAGADRILRVGTDIQANETVTTTANDRAHLVFLDGTTVTIGPNSRLTIDKFVYDPTTEKGELSMNVSTGVFRVIGGRISKTSEVKVATPSASLGIRGGIMVSDVTATNTTAFFVFGNHMRVTANGVTQTISIPGLGSITNRGSVPGAPTVIQGSLSAALASLVTNAQTSAAVVQAIQTLVANNVGNAVTLATVLQTIINAAAADTLATTTSILTPTNNVVTVTENSNQTGKSPN
jgi:hypothetical protein